MTRLRLATVGATFAWFLESTLLPVWQAVPWTAWLR